MKNNFQFEFHILYYIVGLFCLLTGHFKDFIWVSILIIIHELGHVTGAMIQNWKIEKVMILPFGGMTLLKEQWNRPILEEWIIVLLGPIYQILFYNILSNLYIVNETFTMYHYLLLGFNLLPIIPLDGFKMLQLLLESFFSYKHAKYIGFWISIFVLYGIFYYVFMHKNVLFFVILIFILKENIRFYREIPYQIEKFILERYLYQFTFAKKKQIIGFQLEQMKRGYTHFFLIHGKWFHEQELFSYIKQSKFIDNYHKLC